MYSECIQTKANYKQFHPKALACQQILPLSGSNSNSANASTGTATSLLGAIFSNDGIVLFPTHAPYETVAILSHQSCPQYSSSAGSFLSFSKQTSQHKLASTHTNSVLIWDTTGQSLQPLVNRLQYNADHFGKQFGEHPQSSFISLDWNKHDETIVTSLSNTVSVWDIRTNTRLRPSSTYTSCGNATILSVSTSHIEHEFACIDSCGVVRIYDARINHFNKSSSNSSDQIVHLQAHQAGGFGIESIQMDSKQDSSNILHRYLTWGIESVENPLNKSIKIWELNPSETTTSDGGFHPDAYWNMGSVISSAKDQNDKNNAENAHVDNPVTYGCCATLTIENLSNLRVCPEPFEGGLLTVSSNDQRNDDATSWQINLWSLPDTRTAFEIENIASYCYNEKVSSNLMGSEFANANLIATELTLGSSSNSEHRSDFATSSSSAQAGCTVELVVCCLDDEGFVTTHSVQEAQVLNRMKTRSAKGNDRTISDEPDSSLTMKRNTNLKIFQSCSDPDLASHDVRIQRGRGLSDADLQYFMPQTESASINKHSTAPDFIGDDTGGGFLFRKEDNYLFNDTNQLENNDDIINAPIGNIQVHVKPLTDVGQELDLIDEEGLDIHNASLSENDPLKARNVPCPRLCGATFGIGGGMMIFNNGEVKKMWQWYSNSKSSFANADLPHPMKKIISADSLDSMQNFEEESSIIDSYNNPPKSMMTQKSPDFPRSMWGLMQMNEAAKFAQWGDEDEANEEGISESSASDEDADMSDEDCSDESSSSSHDFVYVTGGNADDIRVANTIQQTYFGQEGSYGLPKYTSSELEKCGTTKNDCILAPATESLAPQIFYTAMFDNTILNGQSPDLADVWMFGPWHEKHNSPIRESRFLNIHLKSSTKGKEDKFEKPDNIDQLNHRKAICRHNGRMSFELGHHRKAGVWNLLAQALENIPIHDGYDGWRSFTSGALGQNMLDKVLTYFEIQGDVQMLATVMTVIGGGSLGNQCRDSQSQYNNLRRTNAYIHSYANMLYSWGMVEACAELKKHLHFSSAKPALQEYTGLAFTTNYQQCDRVLIPSNFDFQKQAAFQCSICRLPVRGLFTVCLKCGHGGHLQHKLDWFSENSVCPTGKKTTTTFV